MKNILKKMLSKIWQPNRLSAPTCSVPSFAEYMAMTKALVHEQGFAVPTNPDFYKAQYAQFAKEWESSKMKEVIQLEGDQYEVRGDAKNREVLLNEEWVSADRFIDHLGETQQWDKLVTLAKYGQVVIHSHNTQISKLADD